MGSTLWKEKLQLEITRTIPDFQINSIFAMHFTFYNFCTKKFRRPQESGENCLRIMITRLRQLKNVPLTET